MSFEIAKKGTQILKPKHKTMLGTNAFETQTQESGTMKPTSRTNALKHKLNSKNLGMAMAILFAVSTLSICYPKSVAIFVNYCL